MVFSHLYLSGICTRGLHKSGCRRQELCLIPDHSKEPNSPTIPPTDETDNDSSDSDGESPETKDLKQSIRQQLCKQSIVQSLLLSLCNDILTNPDVFNALVDAVYKAMNLDDNRMSTNLYLWIFQLPMLR